MEDLRERIKIVKSQIAELKKIDESRGRSYKWSKYQMHKIAPYYKGKLERFDLNLYIQNLTTKALNPLLDQLKEQEEREHQPSTPRFAEPEVTLQTAVMLLFHVACPHPIHYRDTAGVIDIEAFKVELQLWMTTISALWRTMDDTTHEESCQCCMTFKRLATNYDDLYPQILTTYEMQEKRVSRCTILRWGQSISNMQCKEAIAHLQSIARDLLQSNVSSRISDVTTDSSTLSDQTEVEGGRISVTTETQATEMRFNERIEKLDAESSDTEEEGFLNSNSSEDENQRHIHTKSQQSQSAPRKRIRYRKTIKYPLSDVIEAAEDKDNTKYILTRLRKTVTCNCFTDAIIGSDGYARLSKIFFEQLQKVHIAFSLYSVMSYKQQLKVFTNYDAMYKRRLKELRAQLEQVRIQYTTRSRKRRREIYTGI